MARPDPARLDSAGLDSGCMATYAIGDIHGERRALAELLGQIEPLLSIRDHVVFLGDYIDRGPETRGVVERLLQLREAAPCPVRFLLGNHEQWLLRTLEDPTRHSWFVGMNGWTTVASYAPEVASELQAEVRARGFDLLKDKLALPYERFFSCMPPEHLAWLRGLEPFVRTPDVACVHGGARAGLPVEDQALPDLVWGDQSFPEDYTGPDRLVYGHWGDALVDEAGRVSPRRNRHGTTFGIDSIAQGLLTCLRFPDEAVFQTERESPAD